MHGKAVISTLVGAVAFALTFYTDAVRRLPIIIQAIIFVVIASLILWTGQFYDYVKEVRENQKLLTKYEQLNLKVANTQQELSELQEVVVSFLEHSQIYREKVKGFLKLSDDYLCIVKSSEGLSKVFQALEEKEMLPFGSVLNQIPGSIRPFERISLFLIPLNSLPGITPKNIPKYIDKVIVSKVAQEREQFLAKLPKKISSQAEIFSFKYLAFFIRRDAITYDTRNRKFNREFVSFIVGGQSDKSLKRMKDQLAEVIKTKDVLTLVDWSSFAKLNKEQKKLIEKNKGRLNNRLQNCGFAKLTDLSRKPEEEFFKAIRPVFSGKITERKTLNLSGKIVNGARNTIAILRKNGVTL